MNMIEKVARAICKSKGTDPDVLCFTGLPQVASIGLYIAPNTQICYPAWQFEIDNVKAAIEAMREPTINMKHAKDKNGETIHYGYNCNVCGGIEQAYYAMIDDALKEE